MDDFGVKRILMTVSGLEDDVESNTRREFERFLLAILQCQREEGVDAIDEEGAEADAQELYDVSPLILGPKTLLLMKS